MAIRVLVSGISGRVGKEIVELIKEDSRFNLIAGLSRNPDNHSGIKTVKNISDINPKDVDGVIDFSLPENFHSVFEWCQANNITLVSGTTGFNLNELPLDKLKFPFLWSSNFSIGINLFKSFLQKFSAVEGWGFHLEDIHHKHKLDAPSGTANTLINTLSNHIKPSNQIDPITSIRFGEVFGVHTLKGISANEVLTIKHEALNRKVFAEGALATLNWLNGKTFGQYSFEDFINDQVKLKDEQSTY